MFLTLGNPATDPRAGLLLPDGESGAVLPFSGRAVAERAPADPVPPAPEPRPEPSRWW